MFEDVHDDLEDIGESFEDFGKLLNKPRFQKELHAIGQKVEATNKKIHRHLEFDDEGLDMWTLSMDNDKFKEVHAERQEQGKMVDEFIHKHKKIQMGLKKLGAEV